MRSLQRRAILLAGLALFALQPRAGHAADPGVTDTEIVIGLFGPMSGQLAASCCTSTAPQTPGR